MQRVFSTTSIFLLLILLSARAVELPTAPKLPLAQKWAFTFTNFADVKRTDLIIERMKQAKQLGYNGFLISDVKFDKFQMLPTGCLENIKRFREACIAEKMMLGVGVAPFGYTNFLLTHDPNLSEGMPVLNAPFIVKDGKLVPHETIAVKGATFEEFRDNVPAGWEVDDPGIVSFQDDKVAYEGKCSLRQQDPSKGSKGVVRLQQVVKVKPHSYYRLSIMVKTEGWTGKDMRIFARGKDLNLNWQPPKIEKTQDWTRINGTFPSLDNDEVIIYIGSYGAKKAEGKIWWDDFKIEPAGFVNILRRDSLPLKLTSPDGKTTYEEGKDFSRVEDPKLFNDPNPGYFTVWHEPAAVSLPQASRLKEGDKVQASFHFAYGAGKSNNFNLCMAEPKTYEIIEKHIAWVKENVKPDLYWLSHDEIRVGGWDDSCVKSGKTVGQLLADCARRCTTFIKTIDPGKPIIIWNDMFDPFHNASDQKDINHYLAKGKSPWAGSWEGLSSDVAILNWRRNNADSLNFFASRGHQQLLGGFYDRDPKEIAEWLEIAKPVKGMVGVVYMSWYDDFSKVGEFMQHVKEWEAKQR